MHRDDDHQIGVDMWGDARGLSKRTRPGAVIARPRSQRTGRSASGHRPIRRLIRRPNAWPASCRVQTTRAFDRSSADSASQCSEFLRCREFKPILHIIDYRRAIHALSTAPPAVRSASQPSLLVARQGFVELASEPHLRPECPVRRQSGWMSATIRMDAAAGFGRRSGVARP
jgi:hypothetical protein